MPAWKVFFIGVSACVCLALALATVLVPMAREGGERWLWLGGLLASTVCAATVLTVFMRHASSSMDAKTRGTRY